MSFWEIIGGIGGWLLGAWLLAAISEAVHPRRLYLRKGRARFRRY